MKQIKHVCHIQKPFEPYDEGWEKGHARVEQRKYEMFDASPMLNKWQDEWGLIVRIIRVTRFRRRLNSQKKETEKVHY